LIKIAKSVVFLVGSFLQVVKYKNVANNHKEVFMSLKEKKPIIVSVKPGKRQKKYREESILDNDHKKNYILKNRKK
jgi:hypothetical protein